MEFIFKFIDPLAVFTFIFATLAVMQGLKYLLARSARACALLDVGFFVILLSWAMGAIVFITMHLVLHKFPVTEATVLQFMIWILLLNGGYKVISDLLDYIKGMKSKV